MSEMPLRILIADAQPIFIKGLLQIFEAHQNSLPTQIVGTANSASELFRLMPERKPEIVILDLNLPDLDGLDLLATWKEKQYECLSMVMSIYEDPKVIKSVFRYGVDGYMLKRCQPHEIVTAIKNLMMGERYLGVGLSLTNGSGLHSRMIKDGKICHSFEQKFVMKYKLTHREMEILKLIGMAKTNKEIGQELFISDQTVSVHRKNIMRKLNVSSTAALIRMVYEYSLV